MLFCVQLVTKKNSLVKLAEDEDGFTLTTFSDLQVTMTQMFTIAIVLTLFTIARDDVEWLHQEVFTVRLLC